MNVEQLKGTKSMTEKNLTTGNGGLQIKADPRATGFKQLLTGDGFKRALANTLPKHISADRFIRVSLSAMQQQPKLFECSPESVMLSLLRAANYGLEPDGGALGHGYLVPFWNGKARRLDCQFIAGYRGLVKLARNSGEVADVWAEVVYEADKFEYELGLSPGLKHKRNDDAADAGALKYVYAIARFRDGERKFIVMNKRDVEKIKSSSASRTKDGKIIGPWVEWEDEQWKKTAVRRLCKLLPLSPEVGGQIDQDDPEAARLSAEAFAAVPAIEVPQGLIEGSQATQAEDQQMTEVTTQQQLVD